MTADGQLTAAFGRCHDGSPCAEIVILHYIIIVVVILNDIILFVIIISTVGVLP